MSRRDVAELGLSMALATCVGEPGAQDADMGDILAHVDPELRDAARMLLSVPALAHETVAAMRSSRAAPELPRRGDIAVTETRILGGQNAPDVPVYIINANPGTKRPGILHMHGGGFVVGAAGFDVPMLQHMAAELDAVIVTVDYRLAPETRYAGSVEDNYRGLAWMYAHPEELGLDRTRIAVAGESAGGGHAALLAIAARDRGEIPVAFQSLVYPMLDDRTGSSRAVAPPIGSLLWTAARNRLGWSAFLGQEAGTDKVPVAAVPARTANLAGLPPAWIGVGSIDLFVQEDIDYGRRLIEAGAATELLVVPGAFHGFDLLAPEASPSARFWRSRIDALRHAFNPISA